MIHFIEPFKSACRKKPCRIVLTEALDIRILAAARYLLDHRLAIPLLLGTPSEIRDFAEQNKISTQGIKIRHPLHDPDFSKFARDLSQQGEARGFPRSDAENLLRNPLNMGLWMVRAGKADLCISGNMEETRTVLRSSLKLTGLKPGKTTISGFYFMIAPDEQRKFLFADCTVAPRPTAAQMAEIAIQAAKIFSRLTGEVPRVAMLSFSTGRSAEHEMTNKVRDAVLIARKLKPSLILDGEIQFDAAIVPEIAARKAPNCRLQGMSNVFVFPSLNAADIGRKILKGLVGYTSVGSFIQGLNGKVIVLSHLCTVEDIINVALVSSGL